ncbi:MAG: 16S rRNA (adenine(1518)-N(6)/adenine(1519)-N(6))-dimethyltransferase RsmA [Anaerosomatales bacterium]|nr:16S rRNA (adenine(1518)-N(6)/adenine(1519)-N(6))-dimethyltransferase RsmA [Anaerosomatales bacterium]
MATSPLANPTATIAVLRSHGLYTRKALGQHFLVDDNVVRRILELADVDTTMHICEVGPGIGTLTVALCQAAGSVVAVEHDTRLVPVLADTLSGCDTVKVVEADAVRVDPASLVVNGRSPDALVSNLPYGVAATVVLRYFHELTALRSATVMVQAEVADRMAAQPGSKAYGAYTVKLRLLARPAGRFAVGRGCFLPPPRVDSAVLRLERHELGDEPTRAVAARIADAAFAQRRKTLRNSLLSTLDVGRDALDALLESARIDGSRRAETLSPEEFMALGSAFAGVGS